MKYLLLTAAFLASGTAMAECRYDGLATICEAQLADNYSPITIPMRGVETRCHDNGNRGLVCDLPVTPTWNLLDNGNRGLVCDLPVTPTWHLLTQSYGGTVSLIKDLTKHECEFARDAAIPYLSGSHMISPGDIKTAECFQ
jgi:hypothetical protein